MDHLTTNRWQRWQKNRFQNQLFDYTVSYVVEMSLNIKGKKHFKMDGIWPTFNLILAAIPKNDHIGAKIDKKDCNLLMGLVFLDLSH